MRRRLEVGSRGARAFTLIEVLVALFVFLTGVTGILALMTTALALHREGLQAGRATRQIDDVIARVQREVAAGGHRAANGEDYADVPALRLPDGTWCAVHFLPPRGVEPLVAEIRLAGTQAGLQPARPVRAVLAEGPAPDQEVLRLREARTRAAPEKP
ncbi:MAG TPA: prepilin-type N-terminal cleavage/methylation domain-containing protein [Planctomycetota bacterium]|nr:prepilin-type N-terminal cleavage/methylation domain-containing protein [Planctomycetota bacterium]